MGEQGNSSPESYALAVADNSYEWYRRAARKARRFFRLSECLHLLVSAAIPVSAVLVTRDARIPAVLGGLVVIITGLRSIFHWQDDFLRFSACREAVEAERRLYLTHGHPYDDPAARDQRLVGAITRIEHEEMEKWLQIAVSRTDTKEKK
ncbi:DUF4231 domain-containing protein [Actinomadura sp. 9N215]|uniref:DUF4231 domain-containing protein n=1 Tax=Actinomadura sp. 9N215 TaxID=3375150 RepID=UPI00379DD8B3